MGAWCTCVSARMSPSHTKAWSTLQEDLFGDAFTLFMPVPNKAQHGENADLFVPNPEHASSRTLGMFEFAGKIMGVSLRNKVCVLLSVLVGKLYRQ